MPGLLDLLAGAGSGGLLTPPQQPGAAATEPSGMTMEQLRQLLSGQAGGAAMPNAFGGQPGANAFGAQASAPQAGGGFDLARLRQLISGQQQQDPGQSLFGLNSMLGGAR